METIEFKPKYKDIFWCWCLCLCLQAVIAAREANARYVEDPATLMKGLSSIAINFGVLLFCFLGNLRRITIEESIVIDRYLLPYDVLPLGSTVLLRESSIQVGALILPLDQYRNSKKLIRILHQLSAEGRIRLEVSPATDTAEHRRRSKLSAGIQIATTLLVLFPISEWIFHYGIQPGIWDAVISLAVMYILYYLFFRYKYRPAAALDLSRY